MEEQKKKIRNMYVLQDNEDVFKINAGGTGLWLFFSITIFIVVVFLKWLRKNLGAMPFGSIFDDILLWALCFIGFSIFTFLYWKLQFIEIRNDQLIAKFGDRANQTRWPKFITVRVELKNIEQVSLERGGMFCLILKIIEKKNDVQNTYFVDTKPFSRAGFKRLISELEKRGIAVEIVKGAI